MKKFIIIASIATLAVSTYAMSKAPADAGVPGADKACAVKEAASGCATEGSCKMDAAKTDAMKAAAEKTECAGGVCPLKK